MVTLNYSEQIKAFQSAITIAPKFYIEFGDKLLCINDDGSVYELNNNNQYSQSIGLMFVVNGDFIQTKVFDNVELYAGLGNDIAILSSKFYTSNQVSTELTQLDVDKRESTYKFAIPRDTGFGRMRDKYMLSEYTIGSSGKLFSLPYIKTSYRYSMI